MIIPGKNGEVARWTTPSIHYKPREAVPADIVEIELTLKQMGKVVVRMGKDDAQSLEDGFLWHLGQEQTAQLVRTATMFVQIDYKTVNGQRYTTRAQEYVVSDSAVNEVI